MNIDPIDPVLAVWAKTGLPARLNVGQVARLLQFAEHDIPVLVAARKLTPLGDPAQNAPKYFAAVEILRLAGDPEWLNKATKEIARHWFDKRIRVRKEDRKLNATN